MTYNRKGQRPIAAESETMTYTNNNQPSANDTENLNAIMREGARRATTARWSKKDYEMVAQVIAYQRIGITEDGAEMLAERFARVFADDNPRFDKVRFLKECGVDL
jgi:hypothetical protein